MDFTVVTNTKLPLFRTVTSLSMHDILELAIFVYGFGNPSLALLEGFIGVTSNLAFSLTAEVAMSGALDICSAVRRFVRRYLWTVTMSYTWLIEMLF